MPKHSYDVTIGADTYTVESDQPLTDMQAYTYAKAQVPTYTADPTFQAAMERAAARRGGALSTRIPHTDELGDAVDAQGHPIAPSALDTAARNPALQGLAHPTSAADFAGLVLPSGEVASQTLLSKIAKPAMRVATGGAGAATGVALAPDDSLFKKVLYGVGGAVAGAGLPDLPSALEHLPVRFSGMVKPLMSAIDAVTSFRNPLTVAGREGRAADALTRFNGLPLSEQMAHLPEVATPIRMRVGGPIASGTETPPSFNSLPLHQQTANLPEVPSPIRKVAPPVRPDAPSFNSRPLHEQMANLPDVPAPLNPRGGGHIASGVESLPQKSLGVSGATPGGAGLTPEEIAFLKKSGLNQDAIDRMIAKGVTLTTPGTTTSGVRVGGRPPVAPAPPVAGPTGVPAVSEARMAEPQQKLGGTEGVRVTPPVPSTADTDLITRMKAHRAEIESLGAHEESGGPGLDAEDTGVALKQKYPEMYGGFTRDQMTTAVRVQRSGQSGLTSGAHFKALRPYVEKVSTPAEARALILKGGPNGQKLNPAAIEGYTTLFNEKFGPNWSEE